MSSEFLILVSENGQSKKRRKEGKAEGRKEGKKEEPMKGRKKRQTEGRTKESRKMG